MTRSGAGCARPAARKSSETLPLANTRSTGRAKGKCSACPVEMTWGSRLTAATPPVQTGLCGVHVPPGRDGYQAPDGLHRQREHDTGTEEVQRFVRTHHVEPVPHAAQGRTCPRWQGWPGTRAVRSRLPGSVEQHG